MASSAEKLSELTDTFEQDGLYFEYTKAADPIGSGSISRVPYAEFGRDLHENGATRVIPLDLSKELGIAVPATSPALCANFVRILAQQKITTKPNATSQLIYVLKGQGVTIFDGASIPWAEGDFLALPSGSGATHQARKESSFYLIHDEPLLHYLGATATEQRFKPTLYKSAESLAQLSKVENEAEAINRSRVSVLLANKAMDQTLTITHTLWAMLGVLLPGTVQLPHRHQSVALDLILDCQPGCYSLVGNKLGPDKKIIDARRIDWKPYSVFITPPGEWHAHFNESSKKAHLIPLQDAGLQTYLRTLDIQFVLPDRK